MPARRNLTDQELIGLRTDDFYSFIKAEGISRNEAEAMIGRRRKLINRFVLLIEQYLGPIL